MAKQRTLAQIIAAEPALAEVRGRLAPIAVLQQLCRQHLPRTLRDNVRVGEAAGQELKLFVDNGSMATQLRQHTPELLALLKRKGYEFTGIRVGVQVRTAVREYKESLPKQIDATGRQTLGRLADSLGQENPLRSAVERLLARSEGTGDGPPRK
jgi:hypothetical protein